MPRFERVAFNPDFLSYQDGFELQQNVHAEVVSGKREDTVLLLEQMPASFRTMVLSLWKRIAVER
jgi:hypothetical protein